MAEDSSAIVQSHATDYGFDLETVELGLRLIVLSGGNVSRAARQMEANGTPVDVRTLASWKNERHATRYEQVIAEVRAELSESVADTSMAIADGANEVTNDMLARLKTELHDVPAKELARSVQALAQASSTHVQTARLIAEKPNVIAELRPPAEILAELKDLGVVEGTASEIP